MALSCFLILQENSSSNTEVFKATSRLCLFSEVISIRPQIQQQLTFQHSFNASLLQIASHTLPHFNNPMRRHFYLHFQMRKRHWDVSLLVQMKQLVSSRFKISGIPELTFLITRVLSLTAISALHCRTLPQLVPLHSNSKLYALVLLPNPGASNAAPRTENAFRRYSLNWRTQVETALTEWITVDKSN